MAVVDGSTVAHVDARALTTPAVVVSVAGAKVFFSAMPTFERKKNKKKQRAGRAGLNSRWGAATSTATSMEVDGTVPRPTDCVRARAPPHTPRSCARTSSAQQPRSVSRRLDVDVIDRTATRTVS